MELSEEALCLAFAEKVKESPQFRLWLLNKTKFATHGPKVRVLHEEQMSLRPRKYWWKHWWCKFPGQKKAGDEIDIFIVFEISQSKRRFALHIENKRHNGKFEDGQPEGYRLRAQHMANREDYLAYDDFETILISPAAFRSKYKIACDLFDSRVSYEELAQFIPEFGT
jgi:hypothetical protein